MLQFDRKIRQLPRTNNRTGEYRNLVNGDIFCLLLGLLMTFQITAQARNELKGVGSPFPEIRITMPERQFLYLQKQKGSKLNLKNSQMTYNGTPTKIKDIHLRGKSTLHYQRKSFSVDLDDAIKVTIDGQNVSLKKFDLLNLAMDRNLWHNRWSFLLLSNMGIFPPVNTYSTLWINDQPQGIYLLVEKPQSAMSQLKSPYMIRRGIEHKIDQEYVAIDSKDSVKGYRKKYYALYDAARLKEEALYHHLQKVLNIEAYFKWMGFNYFVKNGDYSDELFLYIDPNSGRYKVMAWDYDDLLMDYPHEGRAARYQMLKDHMIFSLEDDLDKTIASDEYVYEHYKGVLKTLLQTIDDDLLDAVAQQVLGELQILNEDTINGEVTRYLDRDPFKSESAVYDIDHTTQFLKMRRTVLLKQL
ncbi:MAG: CotH kinase family protein [Maribacter sp.]|nr:CotH kinase family protein [Maribacter sp.]